jgi:hypothetical protein
MNRISAPSMAGLYANALSTGALERLNVNPEAYLRWLLPLRNEPDRAVRASLRSGTQDG